MTQKLTRFWGFFSSDSRRLRQLLIVFSALAFVVTYTVFQVSHQVKSKADSNIVYVPTSGAGAILDTCSQTAGQNPPDVSAALASFINSQAAGVTINFPSNACYMVQEPLDISAANNVTINGNGSVIERTDQTINAKGNNSPMILLLSNNGPYIPARNAT
jgi:hypothetical protein